MKTPLLILLATLLLGFSVQPARAAVIISNLDPNNTNFGLNAPEIGQATLTGDRPISLTSVQILQASGLTASETFAVYIRNLDGSLGAPAFSGFTLAYDSATTETTATVSGSFTLQANSGYFFVLSSGTSSNAEWNYTNSTDYATAFGASLPANNASFFFTGSSIIYRSLAAGPQQFQVNGVALAPVPEPSTCALISVGALLLGITSVRRIRRRVIWAE